MTAEDYPDDYIEDYADGDIAPPFEPDPDAEPDENFGADAPGEQAPLPPEQNLGAANQIWRRWVEDNMARLARTVTDTSQVARNLTIGQAGVHAQLDETAATLEETTAVVEQQSEVVLSNAEPAQPTDPVLYSASGQVTITWDGMLYQINTSGNLSPRAPGPGFKSVIVQMSEVQPTLRPVVPVPEPDDDTLGPEDDTYFQEDEGTFGGPNGELVGEDDAPEMAFPDTDDGDLGGALPDDDVWVDPTPWVQVGQALTAAGGIVVSPPAKSTRWFRLLSTDFQGRMSEPSEFRAIVVAPTLASEIEDAVINKLNDAYDMGDQALTDVANSIGSSVDEYYVSNSNVIPPGPGAAWSPDTPDWTPGQYVWRRTKNTTLGGTSSYTSPVVVTGNDGTPGTDAVFMRVLSSNGNAFKHSQIATTLHATVIKGSLQITDITTLRNAFGNGAYLEWKWQRNGESTWSTISSADPRLGNSGFTLSVSPADVDERTSFQCNLMT